MRFPVDLLARIDVRVGSRERTAWFEAAAEEKLARDAVFGLNRCPTPGCGFRSDSASDTCPTHHSRVVADTRRASA